jgi:hypothetical protein
MKRDVVEERIGVEGCVVEGIRHCVSLPAEALFDIDRLATEDDHVYAEDVPPLRAVVAVDVAA